jgi:hypothetical protein
MKGKVIFVKRNIIEGILIFVIIIIVGFLIWNYGNYMNSKTILENEYAYNAIKLTNTENTITTTTYLDTGSPTKYVTTLYMENGKITKTIEEEYYKSINSAQQSYNWTVKHSSMDPNKISIKKNVVTYTNDIPEISFDTTEAIEILTNQDIIKYVEEHINQSYPGFTRVY